MNAAGTTTNNAAAGSTLGDSGREEVSSRLGFRESSQGRK